MATVKKFSPVPPLPIYARLKAIEVVGNLQKQTHFLIIFVDDIICVESEKIAKETSPRWEWSDSGHKFLCHPSSTLTIYVYRKSKLPGIKHLVGEHSGKVIDLLESDATIDLTNENGAVIIPKIKIDLSVEPVTNQGFKTFMESVDLNISRIDTTQLPPGLATIGAALQITANIMDVVSDAHPILKASWTNLSAVYSVVQETELQDDSVRDLAEQLQETLGLAKEYPNLLQVSGTTNVIEEIGRISLKANSLIYEYTRPKFARRALNLQLSADLKDRIAKCQKTCADLREKFRMRIMIETNNVAKEIKLDNTKIQRTLDIVQNDRLAREIWDWLSASDSSPNYHAALEKHQEGTFTWFLDSKWFNEFEETAGFLWIKGTAGCGKTVLCSTIIEKIIKLHEEKPESVAYAHFFFDGRDSQKDLQLHDKLLRSLIWQLSSQCNGIPAVLADLYGKGYKQPSVNALQDTLRRIIEGFNSVYIIIDSLDECVEREKTLPWIQQIISGEMDNIHMVVASRPERDISDAFKLLDVNLVDLVNEINEDIARYLDKEVRLLTKWDESTRENVKSTLREGAQGMFRWVALQLTELRKCSNQSAVLKQLQNLPKGLFETYDQILSKIDKQTDSTDTRTFLRFLSFSIRPLSLKEVAAAAVVELDGESGPHYAPSHQYWDEHDVLEKCSGLIAESEDGIVKLAHFSVKEYLLSNHLLSGSISSFYLTSAELSHSLISQTCLAYLLHFDEPNSLNDLESFPLAQYAAENWISHIRSASIENTGTSVTWTLAKRLFEPSGNTWINWVKIHDLQSPWKHPNPARVPAGTTLYYASLAGLGPVAQYLLESERADANAEGEEYGFALQAASYAGDAEVVQLLLKNGADVNAQGGRYDSALRAASHRGHTKIVQLLLENGADANIIGYVTAIQSASFSGHVEIVRMLLENGADPNLASGEYNSTFHTSTYANRYDSIIELLAIESTEISSIGRHYGSALQAASYQRQAEIVELLLENGADVNLEGGMYGNALQAAACEGYAEIVEFLLAKGAEVNAKGGEYGSALQAASYQGHAEIVELLLAKGADANMEAGKYGTALKAALDQEHPAVAEVLLQNGAEVNARREGYCDVLHVAAYQGKDWIVELLLRYGADIDARDGYHGNALYAASQGGHDAIVELLLERGARVDMKAGEYSNALRAASAWAYDGVVKLLEGAAQRVSFSDIVLEDPSKQ